MSINLTQKFVYETDDLKSFRIVLNSISNVLFSDKKHKPKILINEPSHWGDGKYEDNDDDSHFILHNKTNALVLKKSCCYHGAIVVKKIEEKQNLDEAAKAANDLRKPIFPKRKWITTIFDYKSEGSKEKTISFYSFEGLADAVIDLCKQVDSRKFMNDFNHAEDGCFDGGVQLGYRIEWRPNGGFDVLDISAIHVYYGK